ncbi:hypothetical protein EB796_022000 [Bugula neritina]|uniref:Uncharacterized protein n=1 Tax=Bugula neritina TaxID=10212 RepID=A0A7J7J0S6_BUGNE|nr:hypothetical protein EB796_022000 [Bugula neritina]
MFPILTAILYSAILYFNLPSNRLFFTLHKSTLHYSIQCCSTPLGSTLLQLYTILLCILLLSQLYALPNC